MSEWAGSIDLRETLHKRYNVLAALATKPQTKPELVNTIDPSRSTIDRAISALEEVACIERRRTHYHLTQLGHVALTEHKQYRETMNGIARAEDILNVLPDDVDVDPAFLRGVSVQSSDPHAPESVLETSITQLESADTLVGLAPVILSIYTNVLTDLVRKQGLQVEIILHENTLDSLLKYYSDQFTTAEVTDYFDFYVTEQDLPYALWIMEQDDDSLVGITIHENGGVSGVLTNDTPDAVGWAYDQYTTYLDEGKSVVLDTC